MQTRKIQKESAKVFETQIKGNEKRPITQATTKQKQKKVISFSFEGDGGGGSKNNTKPSEPWILILTDNTDNDDDTNNNYWLGCYSHMENVVWEKLKLKTVKIEERNIS